MKATTSVIRSAITATILCALPGLTIAKNDTPPLQPVSVPKVILTDGNRTVVRTAKELGLSPQVDTTALTAALKRIAPTFHQEAVEPALYLHNSKVLIAPGTDARSLNTAATVEKITRMWKPGQPSLNVTVALSKRPPTRTVESLKGMDTVLARVQTKAWNQSGRNHNIALAASLIDGTLLAPGELFSLNDTVGKRSKERGFRESIIFVNAQEVKGIGGGVSQITGTIFNAAIKAGLHINEAHLHSRPVPYLPLGYDATVAWGDKDMKFTNDSGGPVYIAMDWKYPYLTVTIFGKSEPGRSIHVKADVERLGPGRINTALYRTIRVNGKVTQKEKIVTHAYRWDPTDNKVHDD